MSESDGRQAAIPLNLALGLVALVAGAAAVIVVLLLAVDTLG